MPAQAEQGPFHNLVTGRGGGSEKEPEVCLAPSMCEACAGCLTYIILFNLQNTPMR